MLSASKSTEQPVYINLKLKIMITTKMKLQNNFSSIFLILIIFVTSCSNKLTRDKAALLIKEHYEYPNVEAMKLMLEKNNNQAMLQKGVDEGLLTVRWDIYANAFQGNGNIYSFADKAKPFVAEKYGGWNGDGGAMVITNCRDFFEVTGIRENEQAKTAVVEFTCKRKGITPMGTLLDLKEGDIINYTVNMNLYDDGWRIAEDKRQNLKLESYAFFSKDGSYSEPKISASERDAIEKAKQDSIAMVQQAISDSIEAVREYERRKTGQ
jgi:hypothetical protein